MLGWFNDEHFTLYDNINMSFAYTCKLSCNSFMWFISCDNSTALHFTRHDNHYRINVTYVQQLREIKMDDIYIYHLYTLSLSSLTMFQKKHRRGRLHFQERKDDMDMMTSDTYDQIKYAVCVNIIFRSFQVLIFSYIIL